MERASTRKTEEKAINKINCLIDEISCAISNIEKNDKTITWDGTIDFYNGNVDKKANLDFFIDVQVKGRTRNKKKLENKSQFDLDILDLKNYLKKDGTLLLVVEFKNNSNEYKIYFASLLPYDIHKYLEYVKDTEIEKVKIKTREIKNSIHLETICRNFNIGKNIQKRMKDSAFSENNTLLNSNYVSKFNIWVHNIKDFKPEDLIGTYQYIYTMNDSGDSIAVSYGLISDIDVPIENVITTLDKSIFYNDLSHSKSLEHDLLRFGKAFSVDQTNNKFNIKICGTLNERIKQLSFSNKIISEKKFLIGDKEIKLNENIEQSDDLLMIERVTKKIKDVLLNHNIDKDINLDLWDNEDYKEFSIWMNAIDKGINLHLESNDNMIGFKSIKDLKLSIIAIKQDDNTHKIESIWNNNHDSKYQFKVTSGDKDYYSNNIFLNLNKEAYYSDDININEMKNDLSNSELSDDELILLNMQVLEILDVYDDINNVSLLEYAKFLTEILLEKSSNNSIYYINYCQILKRQDSLGTDEISELIRIRDTSTEDEIKLCCSALMGNKYETEIIKRKLDEGTLTLLMSYPISIYF